MNAREAHTEVRELFYRCQFKRTVATIEDYLTCAAPPENAFNLKLTQSMAFFEMHKVAESRAILRELTQFRQKQSDAYLYATARLAYLDQDYELAERLFKLLADCSETAKDYFQALLGLANVYFSLQHPDEVERLIAELDELDDLIKTDQSLSLKLLKAMVAERFQHDQDAAKHHFQSTLRTAIPLGWNYFAIKSLYGLACLYRDLGKHEALDTTLYLLHCYLDPDECVYLTYLVNEKFKDLDVSLSCSLQMDSDMKRISVQGSWIPLHDKPLIYDFLELLYNQRSFVPKAEIAARLWPEEDYRPRSHDPRIFDLARRVRALIEPYENQPVCLLSGRQGYKLAGRDLSAPNFDHEIERRFRHEMYQAR